MSVKLIRLRMTENNYEFLPFLLRLAKVNCLQANNRYFTYLRDQMVGKDFNDIKSTLQKLDIIQGDTLTSYGNFLYLHRHKIEFLKKQLAQKVLIDKGGWAFCHILSMAPGVNREKIWYLYKEIYDEDLQEVYTDISKYKNFLKWIRILKENGDFDDSKFKEYIGLSIFELDNIYSHLHLDTRLCFVALSKLDNSVMHEPKRIRETVELLFNRKLNTHKMDIYRQELENHALILPKGAHGRGQSNKWRLSNKGKRINNKHLQDMFLTDNNLSTIQIFNKSFNELINTVRSSSTHEKGEALEVFTAKLCWILGMRNIIIRHREDVEIDVVGEIHFPLYNKILVQCKNQSNSVGPPIIAKELGTASIEKYNSLIMVSYSGFTSETREYIKKAMTYTGINILLFDQEDIDRISSSSSTNEEISNVYDIFKRETKLVADIRNSNYSRTTKMQFEMMLYKVTKENSLTENDYSRAKAIMESLELTLPSYKDDQFEEVYRNKYKVYSRLNN
ncbi:MAG: restriction endonuclease [Halanaerobiales bacterium]